jgi:hypothetical protein
MISILTLLQNAHKFNDTDVKLNVQELYSNQVKHIACAELGPQLVQGCQSRIPIVRQHYQRINPQLLRLQVRLPLLLKIDSPYKNSFLPLSTECHQKNMYVSHAEYVYTLFYSVSCDMVKEIIITDTNK